MTKREFFETIMSLRILVCGDVEGKYVELYKKVSLIQKKQKDFDMLLCIGEFFSENPASIAEFKKYQSGELKVGQMIQE